MCFHDKSNAILSSSISPALRSIEVSWLYVLGHVPLSIAYGLITIVQVLVPLGAWVFLGETISAWRWVAIACVLCGTLLVARSAAKIEEAT